MRKPWLANVLGDNGSGTFAFQTREGGKGILQIIGRSERGVKLRYKLVAFNDDAQISPPGSYRVADLGAKVPADAKPAFGPVMERVLPNGVPCRQLYFQFRSGEIFIVGNGPGTSAAEAAYDEKKIDDAGGVDMSSAGGEEGIQIVGRGCIFTRDAQDLKWDTYTAEQVVEQMKYVSFVEGVVEPRKKDFPITYLFKTARGELGIMEVLGVVNDQRDGWVEKGMKFRYKLVEGGGTKVAPTPPSLVFGPETRGLQAALEVTPGEPFKLRFHIRNVSDTGISIEGAQHRQADDCILEDARGQRVEVVNARRDIKTAMKGGYFIKGQIAVLESAGLSFLPVDKAPASASYIAKAKPGRYTLRFRIHLPGADVPFAPESHVWHGDLETAPVMVEVKDSSAAAPVPAPDDSISLEQAVNDFNKRYYHGFAAAAGQAPLTVEAVVAAIRWAMLDRAKLSVTNETFAALGKVLQTHKLPKDFELELLTGYQPNDEATFDVWSVRLRIPGTVIPGGTTCIMIHEQQLGSHVIGEEERKVIHAWQEKQKTMGSLEMAQEAGKYQQERAAAAVMDAKNKTAPK